MRQPDGSDLPEVKRQRLTVLQVELRLRCAVPYPSHWLLKECARCHGIKPIVDFTRLSTGRHGVLNYCKLCRRDDDRARASAQQRPADPKAKKRCSNCKYVKPVVDFHRHRNSVDGYASQCKVCLRRFNKRRFTPEQIEAARQLQTERLAAELGVPVPDYHLKRCRHCTQVKSVANFTSSNNARDGLCLYCHPCRNIRYPDKRSSRKS